MNKRCFCFMVGFLFFQGTFAQTEKDSLFLKFRLLFETQPLELDKTYVSKNSDSLQLSVFKFYISGIQVHFTDKSVLTESNSYHLIDIEKPNSLRFPVCKKNGKEIAKIEFHIGIDSTASVSGALEGELDPAKGMYWAWQSGYINMKIEGRSPSCKTRKNQFHFHIGGYQKPEYAMRKVTLVPKDNLNVSVDIAELFSKVSLRQINSVMIPGKKAMELADYSTIMFKAE